MTVEFRTSFLRDLKAIKDASLTVRIQSAIQTVEQAETLADVPNLIKLQGGGNSYRIRVGDYRLGITVADQVVAFVRCLNRSDIYKHFP